MSLIELKNISKIYNTTAIPVNALKEVTINFEEKEFTSIVGPSGSGNTAWRWWQISLSSSNPRFHRSGTFWSKSGGGLLDLDRVGL